MSHTPGPWTAEPTPSSQFVTRGKGTSMTHMPTDLRHRAQIAASYLERLTMSLRKREVDARKQGDQDAARSAATWAERAQELRAYITSTQPVGRGNTHERS